MISLVEPTKSEESLHVVRGRYPMTLEGPQGVSGNCAGDPCWPL